MHFQPMAIGLEPGPDLSILVVGSIVLNQNRSLATVAPSQLFEEPEIRGGLENCFLPIIEPRTPELAGPENVPILAVSRHANFRWAPYAAPGGVERRILPEAGCVGEEEWPVVASGLFFQAGIDAA